SQRCRLGCKWRAIIDRSSRQLEGSSIDVHIDYRADVGAVSRNSDQGLLDFCPYGTDVRELQNISRGPFTAEVAAYSPGRTSHVERIPIGANLRELLVEAVQIFPDDDRRQLVQQQMRHEAEPDPLQVRNVFQRK